MTRGLITALWLFAGCSTPPTEIVLTVDVELSPCEVDAITLELAGPTETESLGPFNVETLTLPVSLGLRPAAGGSVTVTVQGLRRGEVVAVVRERAAFASEDSLLWPIVLGPECLLPIGASPNPIAECDRADRTLDAFGAVPAPVTRRECGVELCNGIDDDGDDAIDEDEPGLASTLCPSETGERPRWCSDGRCEERLYDRYRVTTVNQPSDFVDACAASSRWEPTRFRFLDVVELFTSCGPTYRETGADACSEAEPAIGITSCCDLPTVVDDLEFRLYGQIITTEDLYISGGGGIGVSRSVTQLPSDISRSYVQGPAVFPFWEVPSTHSVAVGGISPVCIATQGDDEVVVTWQDVCLQPCGRFDSEATRLRFSAIFRRSADPNADDRILFQYDFPSVMPGPIGDRVDGLGAIVGVRDRGEANCGPTECNDEGLCPDGSPCGFTTFIHRAKPGAPSPFESVDRRVLFVPCYEGLPCPTGN